MNLEEEHRKTLLDNLHKFQQSGTFTDVSLIVNSAEFKAHRYILAAQSPYFNAMFSGNMLEAGSPVVKISGVNTLGFDIVLKYMYTGRLDMDEENVVDVITTALYLQIDPVVQKCVEFFTSNMHLDNMLEYLEIATTYQLETLRDKVVDKLSEQFMQRDDLLRNLHVDMVKFIVSRDVRIEGSEIMVLRVVLSWFLYGSYSETKQKQNAAHDILQHIHFEEISYRTFKNVLLEYFPVPCTRNVPLKETLVALYASRVSKDVPEDSQSTRGMKDAILRIGGFTNKGLTNEIVFSFVDERDWHPLTQIPGVAQCNFGSAVLHNQLYIVGGCFDQMMFEVVHPNSFRYNPAWDVWERIEKMRVDRCRFTLTAMNGCLYAVGGATWDSVTRTAERYDVKSNTWTCIESLPECRQQHAAVAVEHKAAHLLFVAGGIHKETVIASMFMFNERTNAWTSCAPLLAPRTDHVMFAYRGEVYVCGGWHVVPGISIWCRPMRYQVPTLDAYNIETNTWRHVTRLPHSRYHENIVLHGSKLYIIGGFYRWNDFQKQTTVDCYDLETNRWATCVKSEQNYWEHANALMKIPKDAL